MKRILLIVSVVFFCGCQTLPLAMLVGPDDAKLGMTKAEVYKKWGAPNNWSKHTVDQKVYESWYYYDFSATFDFVDNSLEGFMVNSRYYAKDKVEDLRDLK